ncbi:hypothetical protein VNO78_32916 [Psophocarpus tetragonolobus]|uniref:Uncharacterized protein n=1 Tax=Psophocarpus tetragonolobus TaxID=3891 RepID=A0AAN9RPC1_PSOTE
MAKFCAAAAAAPNRVAADGDLPPEVKLDMVFEVSDCGRGYCGDFFAREQELHDSATNALNLRSYHHNYLDGRAGLSLHQQPFPLSESHCKFKSGNEVEAFCHHH